VSQDWQTLDLSKSNDSTQPEQKNSKVKPLELLQTIHKGESSQWAAKFLVQLFSLLV
jgi:hypothetical protein